MSLVRHSIADPDGSPATLGEPKYFISVVEEIGDRKRCELGRDEAEAALQARARELAEANLLLTQAATLINLRNQELDQFVHVVSHDLKAPLRAIANLSEWIETDLAGQLPAENEQQLQLLRTRVQRMTTMIDDLLTYSRIGRVAGTTEAVDVAEFLAEIIDTLDPPPTFTIEIGSPMPILQTERLPLSQVFANLISNAIKHRDRPQGHLRISSREQAEFYEFALRDDGPGIAPEHHDQIFTIFQALKPNQESTGIGLSIVRKIVETEGGRIRLESQVGEGTTFYFTWPRNGG
ncbi:MAG: GHKL domain-containing protein [Acaryochloris sp. SU_5_25]|nr:GHKL domain-containing protein [Acaryochloris sp. SU_5_25]